MTFDGVERNLSTRGIAGDNYQLLQQSSPDIELVRDDLSFILAQAIDSALINGGGRSACRRSVQCGHQTANLATLSQHSGDASKLDLVNTSAANIRGKHEGVSWPALKAAGIAGYDEGSVGEYRVLCCRFTKNRHAERTAASSLAVVASDARHLVRDILVNPFDSVAYARGGVLVRAMSTVDVAYHVIPGVRGCRRRHLKGCEC
jgi:hypothetical protein